MTGSVDGKRMNPRGKLYRYWDLLIGIADIIARQIIGARLGGLAD
jgi:hypothetical protein